MEHVCETLRERLGECLSTSLELPRGRFLEANCAQHAIATSQLWWTTEVYAAFEKLEGGNETAIKDYLAVVVQGLATLSTMVLGELTGEMRAKIKTIITIEVHARDVVARFITNRIDSSQAFAWQSQLKYASTAPLSTACPSTADHPPCHAAGTAGTMRSTTASSTSATPSSSTLPPLASTAPFHSSFPQLSPSPPCHVAGTRTSTRATAAAS